MDFEIVGYPGDEVSLDLSHEDFSYAGKFGVSDTGKSVLREDDEIVGAVAFDRDRTDDDVVKLRCIEVKAGMRGEGRGSKLARFTTSRLLGEGVEKVKISVNNPYSYHAMYKAGFEYTGEKRGLRDFVLEYPAYDSEGYGEGLKKFLEIDDLSEEERGFVEERLDIAERAQEFTPAMEFF